MNPEKMKQMRLKAGLNKAEAARRLGVSPNQITKWEDGIYRPSYKYRVKMPDVYNCKMSDLIDPVEFRGFPYIERKE